MNLTVNTPRQSQTLRIVGIAHDINSDRYFVEFEFKTIDGQQKNVCFRRDLSDRDMAKDLLQRGAPLPHGSQATKIVRGLLGGMSLPTFHNFRVDGLGRRILPVD